MGYMYPLIKLSRFYLNKGTDRGLVTSTSRSKPYFFHVGHVFIISKGSWTSFLRNPWLVGSLEGTICLKKCTTLHFTC